MSTLPVLIYGAGGFGREVAWLLTESTRGGVSFLPAGFVDDNQNAWGTLINDLPVMGLDTARAQFPDAVVVSGIGAPRVRHLTMAKAFQAGAQSTTVIHDRVERSKWLEIGDGTLICAGCILTTNIVIGRQVHLNLDCTIGHDVRMGDYTTLAPGVHVSGFVTFGERVYVGTGAVIINGTSDSPLYIGDDAVIGAGACVTKSVPAATTVVGVPAKPLVRPG